MGLFDLFDSFDGSTSILDFGLDTLGLGGDSNVGGFPLSLNTGVNAYQANYMPQPFSYGPSSAPTPTPVMASVPMAARAVAAGLPAWSARYPALWQALQTLRARGSTSSIAFLSSMLRKWGPVSLSSVIGAAAVADLVSYKMTHKSRRMNPANTKALRRSLRRLKSFSRLSHRVELQLGRGRTRKVGRGRCSTCRKSPCCC